MWFGDDYIVPHSGSSACFRRAKCRLIINLWENRTRVYDRDDPRKFTTCEGSIVVGAYSAFTVIDTDEQRATAGVIFRPGGAFPFLDLPATELQDRSASLCRSMGSPGCFRITRATSRRAFARSKDSKFSSTHFFSASMLRLSQRILPCLSPSRISDSARLRPDLFRHRSDWSQRSPFHPAFFAAGRPDAEIVLPRAAFPESFA